MKLTCGCEVENEIVEVNLKMRMISDRSLKKVDVMEWRAVAENFKGEYRLG